MAESEWTTVTRKKKSGGGGGAKATSSPSSSSPASSSASSRPASSPSRGGYSSSSSSVPRAVSYGHGVPKPHSGINKQVSHDMDVRRLDEDTGDYHVKKIPSAQASAIARGRQAKGMTQKDLALAIQEQLSVVQSYERGEAIPSQKVLAKMEKALGVKIRGLK